MPICTWTVHQVSLWSQYAATLEWDCTLTNVIPNVYQLKLYYHNLEYWAWTTLQVFVCFSEAQLSGDVLLLEFLCLVSVLPHNLMLYIPFRHSISAFISICHVYKRDASHAYFKSNCYMWKGFMILTLSIGCMAQLNVTEDLPKFLLDGDILSV